MSYATPRLRLQSSLAWKCNNSRGGGDYFGITGGEIRRKCTPHDTRLHYTTLRGVKFFERGRYLAKNNYRVTSYKLGSKGTSYKGQVKLHKIYTYLSPRQRQRHTHAHTHTHTREREEVDTSLCLVLLSVKSCTWNFFPAREQFQKYWVTREKPPWSFRKITPVKNYFSPWTFLKKTPVKQNLARDHFQNRIDHGCLFVSWGKKKHCPRPPLPMITMKCYVGSISKSSVR